MLLNERKLCRLILADKKKRLNGRLLFPRSQTSKDFLPRYGRYSDFLEPPAPGKASGEHFGHEIPRSAKDQRTTTPAEKRN